MIYTIRNQAGEFLRTISCPAGELAFHVRADEVAEEGSALPAPVERVVTYREQRIAEYPPLSDQIDAIMKGGADLEAMRQRVLAVKAKYPKG